MIDANGTTGHETSDSIGDYGEPQAENRGGRHFHAYLKDNNLAAVNTLLETDGPTYTYKGNGRLDRIDYIVIPTHNLDTVKQCEVIDYIDMHQKDEDHLPVACTIEFRQPGRIRSTRPKRDRRKLRSQHHQQLFRDQLAQVPLMTWQTELNDHSDIANLQVNTIADNIFKVDPVRPRKSYITDATFALIRLRRATTRARRAWTADSTSTRAITATAKLAYQLLEATIPTITAAAALYDSSSLLRLVDTGIKMVFHQALGEELQLAAEAFLRHTEPQLTHAIQHDKAMMLSDHADKLTNHIKGHATREEWAEAKLLMRFGGRPPRCATEHPYVEDENGRPIPDADQQAEAELTYFAKAEHSKFNDPQDICDVYNQHAKEATTIRVLFDTPIDNIMTKYEFEDLCQQSKTGRSGGPDGITQDLTHIAPKQIL